MYMVAHNDVTKQHHPFIFDAEVETVYDNVAIGFPCENINPVNNSSRNKMWLFMISDNVTGFHWLCFIKDK